MKCCKKFVVVALAVAVGLGMVGALKSGWGDVLKARMSKAFEKQVPPEVQLERVKLQIAKLDRDIDKGWTPIAERMEDIKKMKKDVDTKTSQLTGLKAELQAAAADLEANTKQVSYSGKRFAPDEARKMLSRELTTYKALTREVEAKSKLVASWEKELGAMKANQDALQDAKTELAARVAEIEADLKVLKLAETKSNVPSGSNTRLDDIKKTLDRLEEKNRIRMTEQDLRNAHKRGEKVSGTTPVADVNDDIVNKIRAVTGKAEDDTIGK